MILVFGKTGQVARELQEYANIIAVGREEANLCDPKACGDLILKLAPSAVINAAAYTSVDEAENDESMALVVNGDAPTMMAKACVELGIPFVHISTDYVFDGTGETPWHPKNPSLPLNAYGRTKLAGEEGIRNSGAVHVILRTSWVVSAHGQNFVKTMLSVSMKMDAMKVVADQIGGVTPARDIAAACMEIAEQLISDPSKSGTYHYSGTPDVCWAELADEIFRKSGRSVVVTPLLTSEYPTLAVRPLNSRLDCSSTEQVFGISRPNWSAGLDLIFEKLKVIT